MLSKTTMELSTSIPTPKARPPKDHHVQGYSVESHQNKGCDNGNNMETAITKSWPWPAERKQGSELPKYRQLLGVKQTLEMDAPINSALHLLQCPHLHACRQLFFLGASASSCRTFLETSISICKVLCFLNGNSHCRPAVCGTGPASHPENCLQPHSHIPKAHHCPQELSEGCLRSHQHTLESPWVRTSPRQPQARLPGRLVLLWHKACCRLVKDNP